MAEVARTFMDTTLGSRVADRAPRQRSKRARLVEEVECTSRSRQTSSGRHSPSRRLGHSTSVQTHYALDLVAGPPSYARVGQPLTSGLTLQVRATPTVSSAARMDLALGRLFAVASLVGGELTESSGVLGSGVLSGQRLMDVVHPLSVFDDSNDGHMAGPPAPTPQVLGYLSFPDLVVRSPGTFRLRVTLLRVGSVDGRHSPHHGGVALNAVDTGPIVVA